MMMNDKLSWLNLVDKLRRKQFKNKLATSFINSYLNTYIITKTVKSTTLSTCLHTHKEDLLFSQPMRTYTSIHYLADSS